ncbi:hypothetical protein HPB50_018099 [Hyalomma asiaticum]|uniref:Uncharacterized protein n=1 Tax=Hyalomma asiaticum TaxID=266040 RepID=A0ACB7RZS1_HYAAI|nr:hypothetical protein HPB50_018099 [Hyalomma asiaticum]
MTATTTEGGGSLLEHIAEHLAEQVVEHLGKNETAGSTEPLMEGEEEEYFRAAAPILFLFVSFILGTLVRFLLKRLNIQLPYTVVLFVFGALMGLVSRQYESLQIYTYLARIDPKLLLHMFLPILIFESAFAMDAHTFMRCFTQCILMAVPGLLICAGLTAFLSVNLFVSYEWGWHSAFLFGSILSATDPVAVVALLRDVARYEISQLDDDLELSSFYGCCAVRRTLRVPCHNFQTFNAAGTSKILTTIIDGEALLNDGSAIVIYEVLVELAVPGRSMTAADIAWMFCRISFGGPLLGLVVGKLSVWYLSKVFNDSVIEITITLSSAYITYYLAETVLQVSGVLAVVALGVVISANKVSISPEVEEFVHSFWEMLSYLANTLIFIIVGIVITERSVSFIEKNDLFLILITYIAITVFRLLMIGMLSPILTRLGYGLKWQDAIIMTWGGLRGAVGLALALSVAESRYINRAKIGNKILIQVSGIVILTLLVNATTTNFLLRILGMNALSAWKQSNMVNAVRHLREVQKRSLQVHREDVFLTDADWKYVEQYTAIGNPYNPKDSGQDADDHNTACNSALPAYMFRKLSHVSLCPDCSEHHLCQPSQQEKDEMLNEARIRMISAQKQDHFVEPVTEKQVYTETRWREKMPSEKWRRPFFVATQHATFNFMLTLVLAADVACTIAELVLRVGSCGQCFATWVLRWTNLAFVTFYFFELVFKVVPLLQKDTEFFSLLDIRHFSILMQLLGRGLRAHFKSYWNIVDFVVLWASVASAAIELEMELSGSWYSPYIVAIRLCRVIRLLHFHRLLRVFLPVGTKVAGVVTHRVNEQLTAGYDIGRGFMMGQYEVSKFLDHMVDYQPIAEKLRKICGDSRLEIVRELAALQEKYPKVAVAVKTRRAVRHVLNTTRDELIELKEAGMLDDGVFHALMESIEEKMMRLHSAPTSIVPAPPTELLRNVNWIKGNEEMFNYFKERATLQTFPSGWSLGKEGDEPSGIYVIVCGVVKVEGTVTESDGGSLPNTDSYHWFVSEGQLQDLLTVGAILGELGVLTRKPRQTRATCDTDVRAFHLSQAVMLEALTRFNRLPSLEYRLWRSCALKVARSILSLEPKYENWSQNKLMMHLDHAFLPDLSTVNSYLVRPSMTDVILVQGVATDVNNSDEFLGPVCIPSTVYSITLRKNVYNDRTILVIVGDENFMPDASLDWSGTGQQRRASVMNNFGLCLLHDVRRRQSVMMDRGDDDETRVRSWSDNFRRRFMSNADPSQLAIGKRRLSMFSTGDKLGLDNPSFVTDKNEHQNEDKPRSWSDKFRVRFGPTEPASGNLNMGNAHDRNNRRMSMFCRMERIDSYGNNESAPKTPERQSRASTKSKESSASKDSNGSKDSGNSKDSNPSNGSSRKSVPEIVFSHF